MQKIAINFWLFRLTIPVMYFCSSSRWAASITHARPETAKTTCGYICVYVFAIARSLHGAPSGAFRTRRRENYRHVAPTALARVAALRFCLLRVFGGLKLR